MDLVELKQRLDQEFSDFSFGKNRFPMLFQTGLDDSAVHSAGVSYLLALGIEFGLPAIAEYPMIVHADERWKKAPKVMPDSIWFHPQTHQPWIAFEFERFEKGDEIKIQEKTRNLAISCYQSSHTIEQCVLIYWLRSGIAPRSIDPLVRIFEQGFSLDNSPVPAPKCPLLLYKFVFCQTKAGAQNNSRIINETPAVYVVNSENPNLLSVCSATKIQNRQRI
ncbi:hypothetical protein D4S03_11015 [bacterium]|nr:MAG: hypothetical protein D4S03_11015 [bacterium]